MGPAGQGYQARLYSWGARLYAYTTGQPGWRASGAALIRHLPPTAGPPRVLDLGCGPGMVVAAVLAQFPDAQVIGLDYAPGMLAAARRELPPPAGPDARAPGWLLADARRLPLAGGRLDAVTAHSVLYLVGDRAALLGEAWRVLRPGGRLVLLEPRVGARLGPALRQARAAGRAGLRFALSVVLWHWYARRHGRVTPAALAEELLAAGFGRVLAEEALFGLAVLARGERPYPAAGRGARVAGQVAEAQAREAQAREAQALETRALETRAEADAAAGASRRAREGRPPGRPLYVLVQQRPHRPGWEPAGESEIRWDVLTAADAAGGPPRVLVFSALPRAVRFMQPAVLAGLALVNRVGRFPAAVVADWGLPLELDPLFETLAAGGELRFPGPLLRVDHRRRVRDAEEHDAGGREAEEREAGERDGDEPGAGANG